MFHSFVMHWIPIPMILSVSSAVECAFPERDKRSDSSGVHPFMPQRFESAVSPADHLPLTAGWRIGFYSYTEYCMIYRGPDFLAVLRLAPPPPPPRPLPLSLQYARPATHRKMRNERQLADRMGGRG
jgi:hypothetical protein